MRAGALASHAPGAKKVLGPELVALGSSPHKRAMQELFDMRIRANRRDRSARLGTELFLLERSFGDCLERLELVEERFARALLLGCPQQAWAERLRKFSRQIDVFDPGPAFAARAGGQILVEDKWSAPRETYDLVLAIGTLDTVNDLRLALRAIRHALRTDGLFLGALPGGDTLPQLRKAMRAADSVHGIAAPHVHPRIEAAALAPLLAEAGFSDPVIDVDRVPVSYASLSKLVEDLRRMGATNVLCSRPRFIDRASLAAAARAFQLSGVNDRTIEIFEILHFAAWARRG